MYACDGQNMLFLQKKFRQCNKKVVFLSDIYYYIVTKFVIGDSYALQQYEKQPIDRNFLGSGA